MLSWFTSIYQDSWTWLGSFLFYLVLPTWLTRGLPSFHLVQPKVESSLMILFFSEYSFDFMFLPDLTGFYHLVRLFSISFGFFLLPRWTTFDSNWNFFDLFFFTNVQLLFEPSFPRRSRMFLLSHFNRVGWHFGEY